MNIYEFIGWLMDLTFSLFLSCHIALPRVLHEGKVTAELRLCHLRRRFHSWADLSFAGWNQTCLAVPCCVSVFWIFLVPILQFAHWKFQMDPNVLLAVILRSFPDHYEALKKETSRMADAKCQETKVAFGSFGVGETQTSQSLHCNPGLSRISRTKKRGVQRSFGVLESSNVQPVITPTNQRNRQPASTSKQTKQSAIKQH